jgi:2-polyprenyl-6-methoxyphenol hydroxylase-like FAD-dependent oxidoreductase
VARDQFVQYLEQYSAYHHLEPRFGVEATRIDRDDGHWCVRTSAGTFPARVVIMADGRLSILRIRWFRVSPRSMAAPSYWPTGHVCSWTPSSQLPAISPDSSRSSATSQQSESTESRARSPASISSELAYP